MRINWIYLNVFNGRSRTLEFVRQVPEAFPLMNERAKRNLIVRTSYVVLTLILSPILIPLMVLILFIRIVRWVFKGILRSAPMRFISWLINEIDTRVDNLNYSNRRVKLLDEFETKVNSDKELKHRVDKWMEHRDEY